MDEYESLSHSKWECKYHVVFIPKCRRKVLYGNLRRHLGEVFRKLAEQKECRIEKGHLLADHVHMMRSAKLTGRTVLDSIPAQQVKSQAYRRRFESPRHGCD